MGLRADIAGHAGMVSYGDPIRLTPLAPLRSVVGLPFSSIGWLQS